jgi:hypothetical protein
MAPFPVDPVSGAEQCEKILPLENGSAITPSK